MKRSEVLKDIIEGKYYLVAVSKEYGKYYDLVKCIYDAFTNGEDADDPGALGLMRYNYDAYCYEDFECFEEYKNVYKIMCLDDIADEDWITDINACINQENYLALLGNGDYRILWHLKEKHYSEYVNYNGPGFYIWDTEDDCHVIYDEEVIKVYELSTKFDI